MCDFVWRPVFGWVAPGVALLTIGEALKKGWPFSVASVFDEFLANRMHSFDIVSINDPGTHRIARRPSRELTHWRGEAHVGVFPVEVVFTDEHNRRPPDGREVHGFMKRTDVGG